MEPVLSFLRFAVEMGAAAGTQVAAAWRRGRPQKTKLVQVSRPAPAGSGIRSTPTPTPTPTVTPGDYAGYSPAEALHQERKHILRALSDLRAARLRARTPSEWNRIDADITYQQRLLDDVDARFRAAREETEQQIRDCETNLELYDPHDPRYSETEAALEAAKQELADLDNHTIGRR